MNQWNIGEFCWLEIGASDAGKAKDFYEKVFNWEYDDMEMPEGMGVYSMWKAAGVECGGLYELNAEQKKMGVPSHWLNYFTVDDCDKFLDKAKECGASVVMEPFDVGGHGRMAIFQDTTQAMFAFWQSKKEEARNVPPRYTHGKPGWRELMTTDVEKAGKFYCDLFGFSLKVENMGDFNYHEFKLGEESIGGMLQIEKDWGPVPSNWMTYINADDIEVCKTTIEANGGKMNMGIKDIPDLGKFAVFQDPNGAAFAAIQFVRK